ncbi:KxYKxGKxW signal peptide domain-containing protein, partial [Leuconostoc pseudomesenteroides]|uniref:KxYKxGKxW signal peptide domain-containing protein n=1 Tax=Leuconostoc pseudomesenteroides TaxID=33968 RepID=UPI0039EBCEBE
MKKLRESKIYIPTNTREHKKMFKAKKNWIVSGLFVVSSIAVGIGLPNTTVAHAADLSGAQQEQSTTDSSKITESQNANQLTLPAATSQASSANQDTSISKTKTTTVNSVSVSAQSSDTNDISATSSANSAANTATNTASNAVSSANSAIAADPTAHPVVASNAGVIASAANNQGAISDDKNQSSASQASDTFEVQGNISGSSITTSDWQSKGFNISVVTPNNATVDPVEIKIGSDGIATATLSDGRTVQFTLDIVNNDPSVKDLLTKVARDQLLVNAKQATIDNDNDEVATLTQAVNDSKKAISDLNNAIADNLQSFANSTSQLSIGTSKLPDGSTVYTFNPNNNIGGIAIKDAKTTVTAKGSDDSDSAGVMTKIIADIRQGNWAQAAKDAITRKHGLIGDSSYQNALDLLIGGTTDDSGGDGYGLFGNLGKSGTWTASKASGLSKTVQDYVETLNNYQSQLTAQQNILATDQAALTTLTSTLQSDKTTLTNAQAAILKQITGPSGIATVNLGNDSDTAKQWTSQAVTALQSMLTSVAKNATDLANGPTYSQSSSLLNALLGTTTGNYAQAINILPNLIIKFGNTSLIGKALTQALTLAQQYQSGAVSNAVTASGKKVESDSFYGQVPGFDLDLTSLTNKTNTLINLLSNPGKYLSYDFFAELSQLSDTTYATTAQITVDPSVLVQRAIATAVQEEVAAVTDISSQINNYVTTTIPNYIAGIVMLWQASGSSSGKISDHANTISSDLQALINYASYKIYDSTATLAQTVASQQLALAQQFITNAGGTSQIVVDSDLGTSQVVIHDQDKIGKALIQVQMVTDMLNEVAAAQYTTINTANEKASKALTQLKSYYHVSDSDLKGDDTTDKKLASILYKMRIFYGDVTAVSILHPIDSATAALNFVNGNVNTTFGAYAQILNSATQSATQSITDQVSKFFSTTDADGLVKKFNDIDQGLIDGFDAIQATNATVTPSVMTAVSVTAQKPDVSSVPTGTFVSDKYTMGATGAVVGQADTLVAYQAIDKTLLQKDIDAVNDSQYADEFTKEVSNATSIVNNSSASQADIDNQVAILEGLTHSGTTTTIDSVHYVGAGNQTPADNVQNVSWDVTTKIIDNTTEYKLNSGAQTVSTPIIDGYYADHSSISFTDSAPQDQTKTVTYNVAYNGSTDQSNSTDNSQSIVDSTSSEESRSISNSSTMSTSDSVATSNSVSNSESLTSTSNQGESQSLSTISSLSDSASWTNSQSTQNSTSLSNSYQSSSDGATSLENSLSDSASQTNVNDKSASNADSQLESESLFESTSSSIADSVSQSESTIQSQSTIDVKSLSESVSALSSTSAKNNDSISNSVSTVASNSGSQHGSTGDSQSIANLNSASNSSITSQSISNYHSDSVKNSQFASESESIAISESKSMQLINSESASIVTSTSSSSSLNTSTSMSQDISNSQSTLKSDSIAKSDSTSKSESISNSDSTSKSDSISNSDSTSKSDSISNSDSTSKSDSISNSDSTSKSESISNSDSTSKSESISNSESTSKSESISNSDSTSKSESISNSDSTSKSESISNSDSTSKSDS